MTSPASTILIFVAAYFCCVAWGAAPSTHSPSHSDGHHDRMVMDQAREMNHDMEDHMKDHKDHDMDMDMDMDMGNMSDHGMMAVFNQRRGATQRAIGDGPGSIPKGKIQGHLVILNHDQITRSCTSLFELQPHPTVRTFEVTTGHESLVFSPFGVYLHEMYFHFGVKEYVLFKEWHITNAGGMIGSVIGVFLMGMLYEGLKYFREYLFKQYISTIQFSTVAMTGESGRVTQVHKVERHQMLSWPHALQTSLHVVQIIVSYFLMLIFMTYNVWLCLGVVFGAGVGYFIFGWKKASVVDITEHCH